MEQLLGFWNALDNRRRLMLGAGLAAALVTVLAIARIAATPSMALLYAGLEGAPAGEVIQALEQRGIRYEVRGDSIWVDARMRDETRMGLAAQGLPANTAGGYELLDGLSGFGTTSQMFDAAYWRAKEGELARTIVASAHVSAARVHISQGGQQPFRREQQVSASVTVTPAGGSLGTVQAEALRFLVASAVPGLEPANVAVIDSVSGLVVAQDDNGTRYSGERAEALRRNVERLIEAHVGRGRAVVEVNVDTVTDRETIVERRLDPESRVAVSEESEERNATNTDTRAGAVTVASNLPDGDAAGGDGRSDSRDIQTRERRTWEVSSLSRELQREPGAIRRLTVAVLVDGVRAPDAGGTMQWQPRSDAELEALRELVASAVGYDPERGDVITLRSLPFEPVAEAAGGIQPGLAERLGLDVMGIIRLLALAVVLLILAFFVIGPVLRAARGNGAQQGGDDGPMALAGLDLPGGDHGFATVPVLTGEIDDDEGPGAMPGVMSGGRATGHDEADPVARMRQLIAERQDETMEILRHWMEDHDGGR
ncbi:MAG: flagellar M-ring protein FliF [Pararhodobacter sp.]|nr:flagellar M-ring protein FliF [Pararhodobacter sp.]